MFIDKQETVFGKGLVRYALEHGGDIVPLEITYHPSDVESVANMNPSVFYDEKTDRMLCNIRAVNYNLFDLSKREFNWENQPTVYVNNVAKLKTINYMCELDKETLFPISSCMIDTSRFDRDPLWTFVGLEDGRLVRWNDRLYLTGVRRDTTTNGQGRMELSELAERSDGTWYEISRTRIPTPGNIDTYCEKNWMPVLDQPYTYLKWTIPTEVAVYDPMKNETTSRYPKFPLFGVPYDCLRGDSHVVRYKDNYWCIGHFCDFKLLNKETNSRTATYWHHLVRMDLDMNILEVSKRWHYDNRFHVEFGCGLCIKDGYALISFSEDDSSVLILKIPCDALFGEDPEKEGQKDA
jgi:hypothetical protein